MNESLNLQCYISHKKNNFPCAILISKKKDLMAPLTFVTNLGSPSLANLFLIAHS